MSDASSAVRSELLKTIARRLASLPTNAVLLVAIDGVDGSGKTCFADELVPHLEEAGRPVLRAGIDGFHNPRSIRYRLGRSSPLGYFLDSYDYGSLRRHLLDPLARGSDTVHTARFDYRTDQPVTTAVRRVEANSILLLDGIFLHRDELRPLWSCSVFLDVSFEVSFARMARRDGSSPDPEAEANRRYFEGQKLYLARCRPRDHAGFVVDNSALASPRVVIERP
jgi:uridine kinase